MAVHTTTGSPLSVLPLAARTTSASSEWFNVSDWIEGTFFIEITAVSGTSPLLTLNMQLRDDTSGTAAEYNDLEGMPVRWPPFSGTTMVAFPVRYLNKFFHFDRSKMHEKNLYLNYFLKNFILLL